MESLHWGGNGGNHSEVNQKSQNVALCAPSWKKIYGDIIEIPTQPSQNSWQGHCKHGLYDREAEGACSSCTDWREELLHCLWSAQGDLNLKYISTFDQCVSSSASPAMGLPCRILRSLPWGCCWSARQSLCSRGEKYWKLSERSTNNAQDFPDVAWARPTGVLNFPDCSPEGQGIPDLGLPNVRPSFCALMQYNTLLSCLRWPSTTPRLLRSVEPITPVLALQTSR